MWCKNGPVEWNIVFSSPASGSVCVHSSLSGKHFVDLVRRLKDAIGDVRIAFESYRATSASLKKFSTITAAVFKVGGPIAEVMALSFFLFAPVSLSNCPRVLPSSME